MAYKLKTDEQLLKLATTHAFQFLTAFAERFATLEAAELDARYPEDGPHDAESLVEDDYGGNALGYLDSEGGAAQIAGLHLKQVESIGGGEGGGERVLRVWAVVKGATKVKPTAKNGHSLFEGGEVISHIRATGYYESYEGTTFDDDAEFVFPKEVTVIKFFNAKELKKVQA